MMRSEARRWNSCSKAVVAVVSVWVLGGSAWQSWGSVSNATVPPTVAKSVATPKAATTPQSALAAPFSDPDSCAIDIPSGVPICWKADAHIFPNYWLTKEINATAADLAPSEKERALRMVTRALRRYPASVLRAHLTAVYLVGKLGFSGISAGGTNSLDRVYIHDEGAKKGYTDAFLERTFHHEFSSVLLRLHPEIWNAPAWRACNAPDFAYGTNGTDAVRDKKASRVFNVKLMERGFWNQYATASPEEDLNETVEAVFCGTSTERAYLIRYPRLGRKAELVRAFYAKLGVIIPRSAAPAPPEHERRANPKAEG